MGGRLIPADVQRLPFGDGSTAVCKSSGVLGLRDGSGNHGNLRAEAVDRWVEKGGIGGAQVVESAGDTTGVGAEKVRAIGMEKC